MELHEPIAVQALTSTNQEIRRILAECYRAVIGVPPLRRAEFRHAVENRVNVTVDELVEDFSEG